MKTAIIGLMLGILAVGGLIATGVFMTSAYATVMNPPPDSDPVNTATASNSDDDPVTQSNTASVTQESKIKCKASVDDNDGVQVGNNVNTAANGCDNYQSASVSQANVNQDDDVQTALATACQAIAGLAATSACANS